MENIANRIKYIRESLLKLSQDELAEAVGVSQMLISYWEAGTRNPKGQNVDKIIEFCESKGIMLSKALVLISNADPKIEDQEQEIELHPAYRRLWKKYTELLEKVNDLKK